MRKFEIYKSDLKKKVYEVDVEKYLSMGWDYTSNVKYKPVLVNKIAEKNTKIEKDLRDALIELKGVSESNVDEILEKSPTLEMVKSMTLEDWCQISRIKEDRANNIIEELKDL